MLVSFAAQQLLFLSDGLEVEHHLSSIVENRKRISVVVGNFDDFFQGVAYKISSLNLLVQVVVVGLVMLPPVKLQS